MIVSIDDVLTKEACKTLIDIFNKNKNLQEEYDNGSMTHILRCRSLINDDFNFTYKVSRYLNNLITKHTGHLVYPDNVQIVLKPPKSSQTAHKDFNTSHITSITYLNTLDSGETFVEDFGKIKPKEGRTIFFNGDEITHGSETTLEDRYTFISWYSKDVQRLDF